VRTILLLRHAKSDWSDASADDHDRPLAPRGQRASERLGRALAALGPCPGAVLTSSAQRARETAQRVLAGAGWSCPLREDRELYLTSPAVVRQRIREQSNDATTLLVVGHEPVWSELAAELTGGRIKLPTGAVARIDLAVERWSDVAPGTGTLLWLLTPKVLKRLET